MTAQPVDTAPRTPHSCTRCLADWHDTCTAHWCQCRQTRHPELLDAANALAVTAARAVALVSAAAVAPPSLVPQRGVDGGVTGAAGTHTDPSRSVPLNGGSRHPLVRIALAAVNATTRGLDPRGWR